VRDLIKFTVVGGFAAMINVLCRIGLGWLMRFEVAVVLAYTVGMMTAYFLNRLVVFTSSGSATLHQMTRFALVNILALGVVLGVSVVLLRVVFPWLNFDWHAETIAHAVGVASPILSSYMLHKHYTFRS
jgi:putative flippase GtrA